MLFKENLKMIADKISTLDSNIPIYTKDIVENMPRPCFHITQVGSKAQLFCKGGEIEVEAEYRITYFADRRYVSAIGMQLVLVELFSRYIEGENYYLFPGEIEFSVFPSEGILEATFHTKQYHSIGSGTEESAAELMQTLIHDEQYEEGNDA